MSVLIFGLLTISGRVETASADHSFRNLAGCEGKKLLRAVRIFFLLSWKGFKYVSLLKGRNRKRRQWEMLKILEREK